MTFEIRPFRALRFKPDAATDPNDLVAPPYDIISPDEHAKLLARSPNNIVHLTLGETPGEKEDYRVRGQRILDWKSAGTLDTETEPGLYVYGADYTIPGTTQSASFRGLVALGKLCPFEERVVLPHERTFPGVVDDRFHLLESTRTHLESIFLLYEDAEKKIDQILEAESAGEPLLSIEARPGETHALWRIDDAQKAAELQTLFSQQRPIIADGHHRYTTGLQYLDRKKDSPQEAPGSGWQLMVFGNLVGDGLSILATHRLVKLGGDTEPALRILRSKLEAAGDDDWDFSVETRGGRETFRVPPSLRQGRPGVLSSDYALLHQVVLAEWLGAREEDVSYFKEGSGELEALERGDGDVLFRMRPVDPGEFRSVVDGGEVFPHKTTFFYPKLWSGLVLWSLEDV